MDFAVPNSGDRKVAQIFLNPGAALLTPTGRSSSHMKTVVGVSSKHPPAVNSVTDTGDNRTNCTLPTSPPSTTHDTPAVRTGDPRKLLPQTREKRRLPLRLGRQQSVRIRE